MALRKSLIIVLFFLLDTKAKSQPTSCRIYCPDGTSHLVDCNTSIDPCKKNLPPPGPSVEEIRFTNSRARYDKLLDFFRMFEIEKIVDVNFVKEDRIYSAPVPVNLQQLENLVDRLYIQATYKKRYYYWKQKQNKQEITSLIKELKLNQANRTKLNNELLELPALLNEENEKKSNAMVKLANEGGLLDDMLNKQNKYKKKLQSEFIQTYEIIYSLMPDKDKAGFTKAWEQKKPWHVNASYDLVQPSPFVPGRISTPSPIIPPKIPFPGNWDKSIPPLPAGTVEDKITSIEAMKTAYDKVGYDVIYQEKEIDKLNKENNSVIMDVAEAAKKVGQYKSQLDKAKTARDEAEEKIKTMILNQRYTASNIVVAYASLVIWDDFKKTVAIPLAKNILKKTGLLEQMELMEAMDEVRRNPAKLIPAYREMKNLNSLIETEKKVLDLIGNFQKYANEATTKLVSGDPAEIKELSDELFADLGDKGVALIKTASEKTNESVGRFMKLLTQRYPRD